MNFVKMHGLGNDFVIIDARHDDIRLHADQITHICDRHFGVGCDQLIVLEVTENADVFMRIYNSDGSESGACGNATRCVAHMLMTDQGIDHCVIETRSGLLPSKMVENGLVCVDMGPARLGWAEIPLSEEVDTLHVGIGEGAVKDPVAVNMGNPHCVFFVDDLDGIDPEEYGPVFETHALYPERTNVEFVQVLDRKTMRLRTWERGVGMTLACGSAACATIVAAVRRGLSDNKADITVDGGGSLHLEYNQDTGHVFMTGPVSYVFQGQLS